MVEETNKKTEMSLSLYIHTHLFSYFLTFVDNKHISQIIIIFLILKILHIPNYHISNSSNSSYFLIEIRSLTLSFSTILLEVAMDLEQSLVVDLMKRSRDWENSRDALDFCFRWWMMFWLWWNRQRNWKKIAGKDNDHR